MTSSSVTNQAEASTDVEADVDDFDLTGELAPATEQQAGLQRSERDGPLGCEHALRSHPGEPVDTTGDVDREHRRRRSPARATIL